MISKRKDDFDQFTEKSLHYPAAWRFWLSILAIDWIGTSLIGLRFLHAIGDVILRVTSTVGINLITGDMSRGIGVPNRIIVGVSIPIKGLRALRGQRYNTIRLGKAVKIRVEPAGYEEVKSKAGLCYGHSTAKPINVRTINPVSILLSTFQKSLFP